MDSLEKVKFQIQHVEPNNYPPVHKWNPPLCGDIDIIIKSNGDWYHEGIKFTRPALVKLFSSILKKEGSDYYLLTPVEKWRIKVELAPLLVIEMVVTEQSGDETQQLIQFKTNTDDVVTLDHIHSLRIFSNGIELKPLVHVRSGLEALIHRNIFYRLADMAKVVDGFYGVWSCGTFHRLE